MEIIVQLMIFDYDKLNDFYIVDAYQCLENNQFKFLGVFDGTIKQIKFSISEIYGNTVLIEPSKFYGWYNHHI